MTKFKKFDWEQLKQRNEEQLKIDEMNDHIAELIIKECDKQIKLWEISTKQNQSAPKKS